MRSRLLIPFTILAALGAFVATGCGGGDDTSSSTTAAAGASGASGTALTQDQWVTQANAICAAGNKETDAAAQDAFGGQQPSQAQIEQYATDVLIPSIQGQIDAIRALTPPEDIADDATAFLDDAETALDQVRDDPSTIAAGNSDGPFADVSQEAHDLGLTECGSA
jgi:hypothetical protein